MIEGSEYLPGNGEKRNFLQGSDLSTVDEHDGFTMSPRLTTARRVLVYRAFADGYVFGSDLPVVVCRF